MGKVETFSGMTYLFVSSVVVKNCTVRQHYTVDFTKPSQKNIPNYIGSVQKRSFHTREEISALQRGKQFVSDNSKCIGTSEGGRGVG